MYYVHLGAGGGTRGTAVLMPTFFYIMMTVLVHAQVYAVEASVPSYSLTRCGSIKPLLYYTASTQAH